MILQALTTYYDRRSSDPASDIAPEGWERKPIPFIIVLDREGRLIQIEDTRDMKEKNNGAKSFLVPLGVKRSSGIEANLLWDTVPYVFGEIGIDRPPDDEDSGKLEKTLDRARDQQRQFIEKIENTLPDDPQAHMIVTFLRTVQEPDLAQFPVWNEMKQLKAVVSFRFQGEFQLYCEGPAVQSAVDRLSMSGEDDGFCLVTGRNDGISKLHTSIKGVRGAQSSGASIVSFNLDPFCSYGKKQGYNAPIGRKGMFAYTTALNELLGSESRQKLSYGDLTLVFWAAEDTEFEADFSFYFSEPPKDDPRDGTERIRALFEAPKTGAYDATDDMTEFYVLGLTPNAARIAVRFWRCGPVSQFATNIRQYFEDLRIVKPPREPEYYSLWRLLVNIAVQGKSENIPPNIAGDLFSAIVDGAPFPLSILQGALRRVHADVSERITPARAAIIKGYLNRYMRMHPHKEDKEMGIALDTDHPSIGYQLGRLFATLEKIQKDASGGTLNATITERYYSAASSSPVTVFGTLLRLMKFHLAKIGSKPSVVYYNQLLSEILGHVGDFPTHLNLQEQGRFAIGYYHQKQAFYTKKESSEPKTMGAQEA